jgi:hypothetical protein
MWQRETPAPGQPAATDDAMSRRPPGRPHPWLRALALLGRVAAGLLAPAGTAPVLAADDPLALVSNATYTLVPDKGVVRVAVAVTATNNKPNRVQQTAAGTITTRYFFDSAAIVVQPEATRVRATAGGAALTTKVSSKEGFKVVEVRFRSDLFYKQSTRFRLDFDLPGGKPRSSSDIRVGSAFATFSAWAFGAAGDVRIVVPSAFEVETAGATVAESVKSGVRTLTSDDITDISGWYVIVVANRHDALTEEPIDLAGGEHLVVRGWPEDREWRTRVTDLLRIGLPVLVEKIGLDWPVAGVIEVSEVHTPLLEGYAGVFYTNEDRIEISEDLDELTIIHEASHAWFNANLFVGRWIDEGFADEYASRVLDEISVGGLAPDRVTPDGTGHVRLNDWVHPGRIGDEETNARERFGYEASWQLIRSLVDEIGEDGMRAVFRAADGHQTAYVGAGTPEVVTITNDWRRFLDLLDEVGRSTTADDIFRTWIVTAEQAPMLDRRAAARQAYAALVALGGDWKPGYVVREPLGRWEFSKATTQIGLATEVLGLRDEIAGVARDLGTTPPASLRTAYEAATSEDGLGPVRDLATKQLAAARALDAAADEVTGERGLLASIGLMGEDPAATLTAASAAFSAGDMDRATADAAKVAAVLDRAVGTGRTRVVVGAGVGIGVGALGLGSVVVLRRRRRAAPEPAPEAAPEPAPEPASTAAAQSAPEPAPSEHPAEAGEPEPYATLGAPRSADPTSDAVPPLGPGNPGDAGGNET